MRLVSIKPSTRPGKKLTAVFDTGGKKTKTVHFGAKSYGDFTRYWKRDPALAKAKRQAYITRHRVNEDWTDPTTPGALSRYILWEKPTVAASIAAFRRRFRV
jgi:hypothetical protein